MEKLKGFLKERAESLHTAEKIWMGELKDIRLLEKLEVGFLDSFEDRERI